MKLVTQIRLWKSTGPLMFSMALALGLILCAPGAQAQDWQIPNCVFGNGGGVIAGGDFKICGTLGQPLTGVTANATYRITCGVCHNLYGVLRTNVLEDTEDVSGIPSAYTLEQNYPNPFNPTTTIGFVLPVRSHVRMKLYNVLGEIVAILVDEQLPAGEHQVTLNGRGLSSGLYFYQMEAGGFVRSKKLVVLK